MPKVVKKGFRLEFDTLASGPYDMAYFYHGNLKVAQLVLIRSETAQELVQVFKQSGITLEIKDDAQGSPAKKF